MHLNLYYPPREGIKNKNLGHFGMHGHKLFIVQKYGHLFKSW